MFEEVETSLACSGGVGTASDVIKAVMAGANAVQLASVLLRKGPEHIAVLCDEVSAWMVEHEYRSLQQMHGSMSRRRCPDPGAYERSNYLRTLQIWDSQGGRDVS
jgi:dihydroorotate dehydrogenase (fumarate)